MKQIVFYLDFVSPYTYLAFETLPQALADLRCRVDYRPVLFAGLLKHHGQLGPAEIVPKREWTSRHALWLAHAHGIPMQLPAAHPFNPLGVLRLALGCGSEGRVERDTVEAVMRHVWRSGADAADTTRLEQLRARLQPRRDPTSAEVKAELRANTDAALGRGAFGVPTYEVDGRLFWGFDAMAMLRAYLEGDSWFASGAWEQAAALPVGQMRK